MKRRLFLLFAALTAIWLQSRAQVHSEYWFSTNRSDVKCTDLILGEQTFEIDGISSLSPGLHFLNIIPFDESGEPGVWQCIPFLMPEGWPVSNDAVFVEYWVTGYDGQPHREPHAGTAVMLNIDARKFSPGIHFLNYRTINSRGEGDAWQNIAFFMPEGWPSTDDGAFVEYWVSGYDQKNHIIPYTGSELNFNIDISQMSYGLHFFNYRTLNQLGEGGAWKQVLFYINNGIFDDELISYEYWIDNEPDTVLSTTVCPGIVQIEIDALNLTPGMHTLYFRAKSWAEIFGETYSCEFEILDDWDSITEVNYEDMPFDIYTIDGKTVRHQVTSRKGLPKGVYIVNGRKEIVK